LGWSIVRALAERELSWRQVAEEIIKEVDSR
jgi:hypothetical protein